jgi:predicted hydrocarbon binding protein
MIFEEKEINELVEKVIAKIKEYYILTLKPLAPSNMSNTEQNTLKYRYEYINRSIEFICLLQNFDKTLLQNTKSRKLEVIEIRSIIAYLIRKGSKNKVSLRELGEQFGKDHASILYNIRTLENLMSTDKKLKEKVAWIEEAFIEKVGKLN